MNIDTSFTPQPTYTLRSANSKLCGHTTISHVPQYTNYNFRHLSRRPLLINQTVQRMRPVQRSEQRSFATSSIPESCDGVDYSGASSTGGEDGKENIPSRSNYNFITQRSVTPERCQQRSVTPKWWQQIPATC